MPRPGFVAPSGGGAIDVFSEADGLSDEAAAADRVARAAAILTGLSQGYRRRTAIAVGPADGPVAASLARAIEITAADQARLGAASTEPVPTLP